MNKSVFSGELDITTLQLGDVVYEYDCNMVMKSIVKSIPIRAEDGTWSWQNETFKSKKTINYMVDENHSWFGPKLYNYIPYMGVKILE